MDESKGLLFSKIYFEITNVCNADCSFCPGTKRAKHFVSFDEFRTVIEKTEGRAEYLYFHLMGEPLLHPEICRFAEYAKNHGFRVMITTNGLLLPTVGKRLIETGAVYKISISFHSYESNSFSVSFTEYMKSCADFVRFAAEKGTIAVIRLWNVEDGASETNEKNLTLLKEYFPDDWTVNRSGYRLGERMFIEFGKRFEWPGHSQQKEDSVFCYGLRDQIGILCDGTVVPCCLDSDGNIRLGNIYENSIDEIIGSERAKTIYNGFTSHRPTEEICRTCGFARKFSDNC